VFSSHPAPDDRAAAASRAAGQQGEAATRDFVTNRDTYMHAVDGLAFGTSRAQGVVRDNRFYHADMGITLAFPRGWIIQNDRDRILAFTRSQESILQITAESRPVDQSPREFLLQRLKGVTLAGGESVTINGMEGYSLLTRSGSPLDQGVGPIRFIVLYRGGSAFIFAGKPTVSSFRWQRPCAISGRPSTRWPNLIAWQLSGPRTRRGWPTTPRTSRRRSTTRKSWS
jgi:predicted Zn-dependent protease